MTFLPDLSTGLGDPIFPPSSGGLASQSRSVVRQMIPDKALHEVVAVVVARVTAQRQRLADGLARSLEQVGVQLVCQDLSSIPWSTRMPAG